MLQSKRNPHNRQEGNRYEGLAWPGVETIAREAGLSPEKAGAALQHMAHARILRSVHLDGQERWEFRLEELARTDPLMQSMLISVLRGAPGLGPTARHVLHELSLLADIELQVTASFSQIRSSLPWLTFWSWRRALRHLSASGILQELRRGNRYSATLWRIIPPGSGVVSTPLEEPLLIEPKIREPSMKRTTTPSPLGGGGSTP